jgi:4-coumarate--CoA ligase
LLALRESIDKKQRKREGKKKAATMPFLAKEHVPIPTKDLLSWAFDDLSYDWDEPVSYTNRHHHQQKIKPQNSFNFPKTNQPPQVYIDALNPTNSISARRARTVIRQLAAGFRALGLQPGETVCIHSFNSIWYPIFFQGVVAAGGVYAGTNPAYTAHELAHALKTSKARFVLSAPELIGPVLKAVESIGWGREMVLVFNPHGEAGIEGHLGGGDLLQHGERDWVRFDDLETARGTTAALLFSSGTTGLPKAAMLSHYNFVAQHTLVYEAPRRPYRAVRLIALPMVSLVLGLEGLLSWVGGEDC